MQTVELKKIVKKYAKTLEDNNYPFFAIYLFGSHIHGKAKKDSDIDVAVISDKLKRNWDKNRILLWKLRRDVDNRIEPHGFTVQDWQNGWDPLVYEIKKTGVRIV